MSNALRLSEKWFQRGLWAVAIVFTWFLIGLGSALVGDLFKVEKTYSIDDFVSQNQAKPIREEIAAARETEQKAFNALEQAQLKLKTAQADTASEKESFRNWLITRTVTQRSENDPDLIARTQKLETLEGLERTVLSQVELQQKILLDTKQAVQAAQKELDALESAASVELDKVTKSQQLKVFLYRLALTLPLLLIAGWLFIEKRKSTHWPFVWGFVFFALFTFFIELVPYLPSYGGYVRYTVGVVLTFVIGRQGIVALNRYLEEQKLAEQKPDFNRRAELSYDVALGRLAKSICPGCERAVDLKNNALDFCPYCGIGLHNHCQVCSTRKNAFAKFCHTCGTKATGDSENNTLSA